MQRIHIALFLLIITIAASFRFTGMNWGDNAHLHPDERFLTMVTTGIDWPKNITQYFETNASPLNPHNRGFSFYVYGTYPAHLTKLVALLLNKDTYDGVTLIGRTLSAIVDLITMIFVFLITKEILKHQAPNSKFGASPYVAMFLYGIMVLPIQLSHFYTVDPYATLFITIGLWRLIKGKIDAWLGIIIALAIGAKISSILFLLPIGLTYLSTWPWNGKSPMTWCKRKHQLLCGIVFLASFIVTLRLIYPYLFDGLLFNQHVLDNWKELKSFDGVSSSFPPALQWIGVPFWQPAMDLVVWGLGLPLGIIAISTIAYYVLGITYHAIQRKKTLRLQYYGTFALLFWILLLLGYQSFQFAKPLRYLYPIYPALAVLSGIFLSRFHLRYFVTLLFCFLLLLWPLSFLSIYTHPHTRITASEWIYTNIPKNSTIAWEHWDDPLPLSHDSHSITEYQTTQLPMYDPDTEDKWQKLTQSIATSNYIVLSSNRVYGGTRHAKNRYPQTNRYYQLLFSGELGFENVAEFTSRPTFFGIQLIDDNAEESFTVYDHPKVTIFRNTDYYSAKSLLDLISSPVM